MQVLDHPEAIAMIMPVYAEADVEGVGDENKLCVQF